MNASGYPEHRSATLLLVAGVSLCTGLALVAQAPLEPAPEVYQDFRGSQPPRGPFRLFAEHAATIQARDDGVRITVPADRNKPNEPVGIMGELRLKGDFEITGTYVIHSVAPPRKGPGCGVSVNVAAHGHPRKWGRIARMRRVDEGNVYVARLDVSDGGAHLEPATASSGQLRLARQGETLFFLVADEPGAVFREIAREPFGADDVEVLRFMVNTNGSATELDVSLVDLRVRQGKPSEFIVAAQPAEVPGLSGGSVPRSRSRRTMWLVGSLFAAVLLASMIAWLSARRRHGVQPARAASAIPDKENSRGGSGIRE